MVRCWDWVDGIPDWRWGGGVYVLYRGKEVVYVGQTGNLRTRLLAHRRRFAFDQIKVSPNDDRRQRQRLERLLIRRLVPFENRMIPSDARMWWERR